MNDRYADLIKEEIDEASATSSDFRTRSLTIVTTSGGLVTLLAGLIAIAAGGNKIWSFPGHARLPLALALFSFVLAALCALAVHIPRNMQRATVEGLEGLIAKKDTDNQANEEVANLRITMLKSMRAVNSEWATLLLAAIAFEIAAIAFAGWMAWEIIGSL